MNQQEFIDLVNQHGDEVAHHRAYKNLSRTLADMIHIDIYGYNLISILGKGHELTNLEAITSWVKATHIQGLPWEYEGETILDDLLIKLERKLSNALWL